MGIEVTYKGEIYIAKYLPKGKCYWFNKPYIEILKDNKTFYKWKSYNNFVLNSYFCEDGIINLIKNKIN